MPTARSSNGRATLRKGDHGGSPLREILRRKQLELSVLHRITESIWTSHDLDHILRQVTAVVTSLTRADSCLLYLVDPKRRELVLRAATRPRPRTIGRLTLKLGEGVTGWVARELKPVAIAQQAFTDPRFKLFHDLPEDRYQAFLSVPILSQGRLVGVINVHHRAPREHGQGEIALLTTVARQVGGALEIKKLAQEALEAKESLETRKLVERAKGILMKDRGLSEPEAYRLLQKEAMNLRKPMKDMAEAVVLATALRRRTA